MSRGAPLLGADGSWPLARAGEALEFLVRRALPIGGEGTLPQSVLRVPPRLLAEADRDPSREEQRWQRWWRWLDAVAHPLGAELELVALGRAEATETLRHAAPALVRVRGVDGPSLALLLRSRRGKLEVVGSDLAVRRVAAADLAAELHPDAAFAEVERQAADLLAKLAFSRKGGARAEAALVDSLAAGRTAGRAFLLRAAPSRAGWPGTLALLREQRLPGLLVAFLVAQLAFAGSWLGSWWLLGRGALEGRLEAGWLLAWSLTLFGLVPLQYLSTRTAGLACLRGSALLQRVLLCGALRLDPGDVRKQGSGRLLGAVMETRALGEAVLGGGIAAVAATIDLALALWVLANGPGGALHAGLLATWILVLVAASARVLRRQRAWTRQRGDATGDLIESMVGHRTRLAQEPRTRWNESEDRQLEHYVTLSQAFDRSAAWLHGMVPRGWLLIGVAGLVPALLRATPEGGLPLAVSVGGVLLAARALQQMALGMGSWIAAACAWQPARQFLRAARQPQVLGEPRAAVDSHDPEPPRRGGNAPEPAGANGNGHAPTASVEPAAPKSPLVTAQDLHCRHPGRDRLALAGVSLHIDAGERILVEGPSGGGKSTLARVLCGIHPSQEGALFLSGLDRETLGESTWRRRVALSPQYHDNHVFMGPLAFNLLLGRAWPPDEADLAEAEAVCQGLGLGPLLRRMPGGLFQMVGETGWQLSHGERSRLFIARALLQRPEVLVLDESFAALDPETLRQCLSFVQAEAPALVVVAHP